MLRDGPIPAFVHGVLEYLAGALFVLAPFLFAFESDTATVVSVAVGVVVLAVAASTRGSTGLVQHLPISIHVVLDYVLAVFLVAAPYLFGFSEETAPTALFLGLGIFHLLLTIGTRFLGRAEAEAGAGLDADAQSDLER
jgi:VIT1/CCC1 family predicted Fe2+/Mn2+ transporter